MALATVEICESNGAGETITHGITNSNMGNTDAANMSTTTHYINQGENSYEKWQRFHVTAMGDATSVSNFKVWRSGALGGSAVHKTNARTTSYGGAATYATPVATTSSIATQTMPTSEPSTANLGIGGSLAGTLTATGYSDYLVHQIQTNASDTVGSTSTMYYQYDQVQ